MAGLRTPRSATYRTGRLIASRAGAGDHHRLWTGWAHLQIPQFDARTHYSYSKVRALEVRLARGYVAGRGEGLDLAEPSETVLRRVLHVHPPSLAGLTEVAEAIAKADCRVVPCPDAYRAMARLGAPGDGGFLAVVVNVDRLESSEFEFFQLAARHYRGTPVYVCGQQTSKESIDRALRLGARKAVDAETLSEHLTPAAPHESITPPTPEPRPAPDVEVVEKEKPAPSEGDTDTDSDNDTEDEPAPLKPPLRVTPQARPKRAGVARVPWLRYEDAPQRTPPKRGGPSAGKPASAPDEPEEPLLSPAELDALIGDQDERGADSGRRKRKGDR